jgi:cytochrome P450
MAANDDLWEYGKEGENFLLILALVLNFKFFRWIFFQPWFQALAGPKPTDKKGMGPLVGFARRAVSERFGPDRKVKKDMLGHFVEKGLSELQCEVEAELQILAGSDSTTTVLRCTLLLLTSTPAAYARLRAEVDEAAQSGSISSPIKYSEALKLPYLAACLWEGMRMYPPLFGLKGKYSPAGGENVNGVFYPEGIEMSICDEAMCRREDIFGPDSHIFRPDRWMEADEETRKRYTRVVDSIFGTGRFQCLGKHIAMMELHKTFVEVSHTFSNSRIIALDANASSYSVSSTGRLRIRSEAWTASPTAFGSTRT